MRVQQMTAVQSAAMSAVPSRKGSPGTKPAARFGMDVTDPNLIPTILGFITLGKILTAGGIGAALTFLWKAAHKIDQAEEGLVQRMGKYQGKRQAGLTFTVPLVDTLTKVDKKEQIMDLERQDVITKDNVTMKVDGVVYYKIVDAEKATFNVKDYKEAIHQLAQPTIRKLVGDLTLDETLGAGARISQQVKDEIDETVREKWGIQITDVELQNIIPPDDIKHAMEKQATAERVRRALVTEAEGKKQAAILTSEGDRDAAINNAEGRKKSSILTAEADQASALLAADAARESAIRRADGEAKAIETVGTKRAQMEQLLLESIKNAGLSPEQVVALQYVKSLPELTNGEGVKSVIPVEMSGLTGLIQGLLHSVHGNDNTGSLISGKADATGAAKSESAAPAKPSAK